MDIDLYEFKETLKKFEHEEFLEFAEEKSIAIVEVGKMTKKIDKKLIQQGYKRGEKVFLVIQ